MGGAGPGPEVDSNDARTQLTLLSSENTLTDLAFLVDIMGHLNQLNFKLQGEKKNISQMWQTVKGFISKQCISPRSSYVNKSFPNIESIY